MAIAAWTPAALNHYPPDEGGLALVRRMRQHGHRTDVIMVTAARDVTAIRAAMRYGALQYLVKPFGFPDLRGKLKAYAQLRRTLDGVSEAGQEQVDRSSGARCAPRTPRRRCPRGTRHRRRN
jgi:response regulator of citrate/malate metabolism